MKIHASNSEIRSPLLRYTHVVVQDHSRFVESKECCNICRLYHRSCIVDLESSWKSELHCEWLHCTPGSCMLPFSIVVGSRFRKHSRTLILEGLQQKAGLFYQLVFANRKSAVRTVSHDVGRVRQNLRDVRVHWGILWYIHFIRIYRFFHFIFESIKIDHKIKR